MTKQEKFLWTVQTALLVNVNRLAVDRKPGTEASDISMTGNWGAITDAIWASERIPEDMNFEDAANEYCGFMFSNQRQAGEECPYWFARGPLGHTPAR